MVTHGSLKVKGILQIFLVCTKGEMYREECGQYAH